MKFFATLAGNKYRQAFVCLRVFFIFFCLLYLLQFSFSSPFGSDVYYHLKHAALIREKGLESASDFPWLQNTIFKDRPADPWFGYHLLLIPFTLGEPLYLAKLSSVFFSAFLFLGFFWLLKKFQISFPLFWALILFILSPAFVSRLLLPRPFVFSIFFSLVSVWFFYKKDYLPIFFTGAAYSFITAESFFLVMLSVLFVFIELVKVKKIDLKLPFFSLMGVFFGFIIRPDFPNNLFFAFDQIFGVLLLKLRGIELSFGSEIAVSLQSFVGDDILLFASFAIPLYYLIIQALEKRTKHLPPIYLYLFSVSFIMAVITLGAAVRFIEYWAPFNVLLLALIFDREFLPQIRKAWRGFESRQAYDLPIFPQKLKKIYKRIYDFCYDLLKVVDKKMFKLVFLFSLLLFFFYFISLHYFSVSAKTPAYNLSVYQEAGAWLEKNTPAGSVVLNEPWSSFSPLFFYNHHNYYSFGMDPAFAFLKNEENYWLWENMVSSGIICDKQECPQALEMEADKAKKVLKNRLGGDYVFLDERKFACGAGERQKFIEFLQEIPLERVFYRAGISIYQIN